MARRVEQRLYPGLPVPAHILFEPLVMDIDDKRLRRLFRLWRKSRNPASGVAGYDMIESEEITPLLRNAILLEIEFVDFLKKDYVYRLYGPDIAQHYGVDMTGMRVSDFPSAVSTFFSDLYDQIAEHKIPIYSQHAPPENVNVTMWERLMLPLGDDGLKWILVINLPKGKRVPAD